MKQLRLSTLFLLTALLIFPILLTACDTAADTADAAFGLRPQAVDVADGAVNGNTVQTNAGPGSANAINNGNGPGGNGPGPSALAQPVVTELDTASAAEVADDEVDTPGAEIRVGEDSALGDPNRIRDRTAHDFDPATAPELTNAEKEGLAFMRQEEKLARDVYLALAAQWSTPIFRNIAGSEQAHMDSVLLLLEQYGLPDPVAGLAEGQFNDPAFQSLYEQFVAQGSQTLVDGLSAGATIEEIDILDLQERLAQTENEYIIQVYGNLLAGSENHLRSFVSNLARQGVTYQPQYLDQATYQAIIDSAGAPGGGYGGGFGGGGKGSGGGNGNGNGNGGGLQDS